ncbi:hypothetical protein KIN20_010335 [Parelaphostrongylus tenuis]|uniref:Uncharacterized protein n=1 Tax=Parelaphostrongylus tenuis TaxID=148309 RepID=A0AAD5M7Q9_PARTN|nr:hypothetical protein KIN20_010335 [Parelaphostrongylus tenuis]
MFSLDRGVAMDLQVIMTVADYNWQEAMHSRHKRAMTVVKMKNLLDTMVEVGREGAIPMNPIIF